MLSSIFIITLLLISNPQANAEIIIIDENTTTDSNITINENDTYHIKSGSILTIIHRLENNGIINNDGIIDIRGWGNSENGFIVNNGSIKNNGVIDTHHGSINNSGTIDNLNKINNDFIINNSGQFNNSGTIINNPGGNIYNKNVFTNDGTIINNCNAQVRGDEVIGNPVLENCEPNELPILIMPKNMTEEATKYNGAMINFEVTATDEEDGVLTPYCDKESDIIFPIGTTIVTCNVEDSDGNFVEDHFSVMVQDTTPPLMSIPADFTVSTIKSHEKINYPKATSSDIVDGELEPVCIPTRDHLFPIGENKISCEVSDNSGNTSKASFILTLEHITSTLPVLTVPGKMIKMATSNNGAEIEFDVTAFDEENDEISVSCDWSSGSIFPIGITTITCSAENKAGKITKSFDIKILGPEPGAESEPGPELKRPSELIIIPPIDITIEAQSKSTPISEITLGNPIIHGIDDPNPEITNNAPSYFPLGTTSVTWSVIISDGDSAKAIQKINLVDTTKPEIKISYPKDDSKIISDFLIINGTSQDKIGVERVEITVNNEELFQDSLITDEWSFQLSDFDMFEDNHLSIIVKAIDTSGNSNEDSVNIIHCSSNQFLHNEQCIDNIHCQENEESINGECVINKNPFPSETPWWILFLVIPASMIIGVTAWYKSKSNSGKSNQTKSDYFHPVEK